MAPSQSGYVSYVPWGSGLRVPALRGRRRGGAPVVDPDHAEEEGLPAPARRHADADRPKGDLVGGDGSDESIGRSVRLDVDGPVRGPDRERRGAVLSDAVGDGGLHVGVGAIGRVATDPFRDDARPGESGEVGRVLRPSALREGVSAVDRETGEQDDRGRGERKEDEELTALPVRLT